ncbi:hypothetical protein FN846DRAFT_911270 [Sphaerosporella brunnea]|uniref:Uncharacterized protein n=1 Tax=Sphaerosporella brunnea TaxID=1250544 RepID=A0A5J5EL88_9PEZI|nr:hypothetical protein FN846DRAFT_911270 [Sphaerosporella brunnea]
MRSIDPGVIAVTRNEESAREKPDDPLDSSILAGYHNTLSNIFQESLTVQAEQFRADLDKLRSRFQAEHTTMLAPTSPDKRKHLSHQPYCSAKAYQANTPAKIPGVMIDESLNFRAHSKAAAVKGWEALGALQFLRIRMDPSWTMAAQGAARPLTVWVALCPAWSRSGTATSANLSIVNTFAIDTMYNNAGNSQYTRRDILAGKALISAGWTVDDALPMTQADRDRAKTPPRQPPWWEKSAMMARQAFAPPPNDNWSGSELDDLGQDALVEEDKVEQARWAQAFRSAAGPDQLGPPAVPLAWKWHREGFIPLSSTLRLTDADTLLAHRKRRFAHRLDTPPATGSDLPWPQQCVRKAEHQRVATAAMRGQKRFRRAARPPASTTVRATLAAAIPCQPIAAICTKPRGTIIIEPDATAAQVPVKWPEPTNTAIAVVSDGSNLELDKWRSAAAYIGANKGAYAAELFGIAAGESWRSPTAESMPSGWQVLVVQQWRGPETRPPVQLL